MRVEPSGAEDERRGADSREAYAESSSRIRAVRTEPSTVRAGAEVATLAGTLLGSHQHELRRLARRLALPGPSAFVTRWIELCGSGTALSGEHSDYPVPVQRAAGLLLESLANDRLELLELQLAELFSDLRDLSLNLASVLAVVGALEEAARLKVSDSAGEDAVQALGRFMTCVAVNLFNSVTSPPSSTASSSRPRRSPPVRAPLPRRLVGVSPGLSQLRAQLEDIARAPGSVLIVGESGTGKELVAEAIHALGNFSEQPFIAVNCAALPRELIESELFGHERGAFTGSRDSAPGLLRAADRGTVFLDEITEMPEAVQPKLLRALEQRAVRPVGGLREVPIGARIVAATNADPERPGELRGLRPDLFYRLCVHRVDVPPLRERMADLEVLIEHFLRELVLAGHSVPNGFAKSSLDLMQRHGWPGNVRELRNVVEHCCATAKCGVVEPHHLPKRLTALRPPQPVAAIPVADVAELDASRPLSLRDVERRHIEQVLKVAGGNKSHAARLLGLSRHQLYLKLERSQSDDES